MIFSKYSRGQVWYIQNFNNNSTGCEQTKSRPCLIVSGNKNNYNSTILQVSPITTRQSDHHPFHVCYVKDNRSQIIEVEQTTCISVNRMNNAKYMYTLDQSMMDKVDKALMIHFDIFGSYMNITSNFNDKFNSTLLRVLKEFSEDKISPSDFMEIIKSLSNLVDKFKSNWNEDDILQYLSDSESMSLSELADKYGLKNESVAAQYKYKFLKRSTSNDI